MPLAEITKFFNGVTAEVIAVDPLTLQIKTTTPDSIMLMRLANTTIVGPNTLMDKSSIATVGTGVPANAPTDRAMSAAPRNPAALSVFISCS